MAPKNSRQPTEEEQKREVSSEEEENSEEESGETEEGSSEEEEEDEEEEEEENQVTTKSFKPQTLIPKSDSNSKPKSKSTSRVSDSEAESDGSPSDYKMQPIAKPAASPAKRTHQEREESQELSRSSKKAKTGEKEKEKEEKKTSGSTPGGVIARLWSDEDEIAVLNGIIDVRKAKGHDYNSEDIYNFMKGKLQGGFSKVQLRTKINRMRKRFLNALKKSPDPVFPKPHDDLSFELSKKIWADEFELSKKIWADDAAAANGSVSVKSGNGNGNGNGMKDAAKNGNVKAEVEEKASVKRENDDNGDEEGEFWSKYPYLSSSFLNMRGNSPSLSISEASVNLLKEKVSSVGDSKAKELNQKWRQLFLEELELNNKMLALMKEQTQLGLNQMIER